MLMQKGGIRRRVKEHRVQEFKEKGYTEVPTGVTDNTVGGRIGGWDINEASSEYEVVPNPFKRLTTAELEQKALEMEVDLSTCKNNEERASKLFSAMEE